jgi:FSR family fosmidomycin resistance protein-like MFS transporter
MFHPEGGKLSNLVAVDHKGANMSIFAVGGSLAFAVGPLILSLAITIFGMKGTSVFFIPAFLMAAIFMINMNNLRDAAAESTARTNQRNEISAKENPLPADESANKDDWPAFIKLSFFIFFRATILFGMVTFIPLYWVGMLMQTQAIGSVALAIYSFATVFSTLVGGFLADRYGYNKIIKIGSLTFIPFLVLFTFVPDLTLSYILLVPMGFAMQLCFSTVISIAQSFLPNHIGFASGITMGMGSSVGAVIAPILGKITDLYGLTTTFYVLIVLSVITAVTGCLVPKHKN